MTANNNVEIEEQTTEQTGLPEQEKVIMSQKELIDGLFAAADYAIDEDCMREIKIERNGKLFFVFKVRPLSEKEVQQIRKSATKYYKNPAGKHLPKIEGDIDIEKLRSLKIYTATVEEDKEKLWDNPQVKAGLNSRGKNIILNHEIIDAVLMGGEKYRVSEIIDDISGYNDDEMPLEEYAKN